jgi:hypothetical protein
MGFGWAGAAKLIAYCLWRVGSGRTAAECRFSGNTLLHQASPVRFNAVRGNQKSYQLTTDWLVCGTSACSDPSMRCAGIKSPISYQ